MLTNNFQETVFPVDVIQRRTSYLLVPALGNLGFRSYGAPFVVTQFNYTCSNNFVITDIPEYEGNQYNLAIRWTIPGTNLVARYKLYSGLTDGINDIPAPQYTNQTIPGQSFIIEVWSLGANYSLVLPTTIKLETSPTLARCSLVDCPEYQLAAYSQCSSLGSQTGLALPFNYLSCATGNPNTIQFGTNYQFDINTGMFELFNITTQQYNPIYIEGQPGHESIVILPQVSQSPVYVAPSTAPQCIEGQEYPWPQYNNNPATGVPCTTIPTISSFPFPSQGANYRYNTTTGNFEILNLTTGNYNALNTQGMAGVETLIIQPATASSAPNLTAIPSQGNNYAIMGDQFQLLNLTTAGYNPIVTNMNPASIAILN